MNLFHTSEITKKCLFCGINYPPDNKSGPRFEASKYCGAKCKIKGWEKWGASRKKCTVCKKTYDLNEYKSKLYCSDKCRYSLQSKKQRAKEKREVRLLAASRKRWKYEKVEEGKVKFGSEFLTLKNYKEPLKEIPRDKGFGWYGTIAITPDGTGIQCHMCGVIVHSLPGHIYNAHKINTTEYREQYGLARSSALVSEEQRMILKQRMLDYLKSLTPEEKEAYLQRRKKAFSKSSVGGTPFEISLETKNKRGTCPDQLLEKIREVKDKLGRTPSLHEFVDVCGTQRYKHLIFKTYGSWAKALEILNFDPKPNYIFSRGQRARIYSDEEILESLKIYAQENRKIPTESDYKRGLIPVGSVVCKRRFGSMEQARRLAGVYEFAEKGLSRKGIQYNQPIEPSI